MVVKKGVYPHEYMEGCQNFNEIPFCEKEEFYSNLNMEDIIAADYYMHAKSVCEDFEITILGE